MIPELRELLTREGAPFEVISHREVYTAQERAATCHVPGRRLAKVVIVRDGAWYVMAVLPATAQLDLSELRRRTRRHDLAVAPSQLRLDVEDRALAIEERQHLEERQRQEQDRRRVARRVAEGDEPLSLVLDREGLEGTEPGRVLVHRLRKFKTDPA